MAQSELWQQVPTVDLTITVSEALNTIITEEAAATHMPPEMVARLLLAAGVETCGHYGKDAYYERRVQAAVSIERWIVSEETRMMEGEEAPF